MNCTFCTRTEKYQWLLTVILKYSIFAHVLKNLLLRGQRMSHKMSSLKSTKMSFSKSFIEDPSTLSSLTWLGIQCLFFCFYRSEQKIRSFFFLFVWKRNTFWIPAFAGMTERSREWQRGRGNDKKNRGNQIKRILHHPRRCSSEWQWMVGVPLVAKKIGRYNDIKLFVA